MQKPTTELYFCEGRRVLIRALLMGLLALPITIQAIRMGSTALAYILLASTLYAFAMAFLNRKAGSIPLMILKDDGIQFFNADGIVPYTSIESFEIERFSTWQDIQLGLALNIYPEKTNTLPHFTRKRWWPPMKVADAFKGKGFRKHLVGFNYGGLRTTDGQKVDRELLGEELLYRIEKAHRDETAQQGTMWVPSSSANDALSSVQS